MKKVLLASTALVVSAGIASADVSLSGFAELGIIDDDTETQFHTDIDVTFTMSGETDGGLTFGASIDLDESDGDPSAAFGNTDEGGETLFISGSFGTLTMGDTDGALDRALTEAIFGGSITDENEHAGYNGNNGLDGTYDGQIARYDYSFGDVALAISAELDDSGAGDPVIGLGVSYDVDLGGVDLGLGLGYQTVSGAGADAAAAPPTTGIDADLIGFSVDAGFAGGFSAAASFIVGDVTDNGVALEDPEHIGLAVGYTMDALTIGLNWGEFSDWVLREDPGESDSSGFGLVVGYDLGGGAELQFGIADNDLDEADGGEDTTVWSLGLAMSF
ncbi:MAG: porin [Pseudomonadota bacterium]